MSGHKSPITCTWSGELSRAVCKEPIYDKLAKRCILHSSDRSKDLSAFQQRVAAKLNSGDHNFVGVYFPKEANFSGKMLRNANFSESEFAGETYFFNTTFLEGVDFFWTKFHVKANFEDASFRADCNFFEAQFRGEVTFCNASFDKGCDFRGAVFFKRTDFVEATFGAALDFRGCQFIETADFYFAEFQGEAGFEQAGFLDGANFIGVEFKSKADFSGAILNSASFEGAQFFETANFASTEFVGVRKFTYASPLKRSFRGGATFYGSTFGGKAYFLANRISAPLDFARTQFGNAAFFSSRPLVVRNRNAKQEGAAQARRRKIRPPEETDPGTRQRPEDSGSNSDSPPQLCFEDVLFEHPELVQFEHFDLRRTTFAGTNVRQIRFHNPLWPKKRLLLPFSERFALYDEVQDNPSDLATLRLLYRDLKGNLEDARDYIAASDFYYGELDIMRRSYHHWSLRWLLSVYRLLAAYAERPSYAFGVFCFWVLLLSSLLSLPLATFSYQEAEETVRSHHLSPVEAASHSLRAVLLRPLFFQPETKLAHGVTLLANIVGPLQLAFWGIALRRRFRR